MGAISLGGSHFMSSDPAEMRGMAVKYLELAKTAIDPREREKFEKYAALYGQMAAQVSRRTAADWPPTLSPMPLETG